jgi:hypothetical protein
MKIITHDGQAHQDDVLSSSLVIFKYNITEIIRGKPTKEEINNPKIWKLDVGNKLNPDINQIDHHHKKMDDCTLSLLLKHWGIWKKAKKVHNWLENIRIIDTKGVHKVAEFYNIPTSTISKFHSFIDRCVLKLFEERKTIKKGEPLFELLRFIGQEFFKQIDNYFKMVSFVEENAEIDTIKEVPIIKCINTEPNNSLYRALSEKKRELWGFGGLVITQNDRNEDEINVRRYNNDRRINFLKLNKFKHDKNIVFIHPNNFIGVFKKMSDYELKQYLKEIII